MSCIQPVVPNDCSIKSPPLLTTSFERVTMIELSDHIKKQFYPEEHKRTSQGDICPSNSGKNGGFKRDNQENKLCPIATDSGI